MLTGVILRLLLWCWYFNQIFTDQVFNFHALLQMDESCISYLLIRKFALFLHPSINPWCFISTFFFFLSPCFALLHPLKCLHFPPAWQALSLWLILLFFTRHRAFKLGNWVLGFMGRCLIAPFALCFEGLIFFMIFHTNVHVFCFNRMRLKKALSFLE